MQGQILLLSTVQAAGPLWQSTGSQDPLNQEKYGPSEIGYRKPFWEGDINFLFLSSYLCIFASGVKKIGETDKEDEGAEPEYKFEWQKTWGHAPKESYLVQGDEFNEQPFGIQVW